MNLKQLRIFFSIFLSLYIFKFSEAYRAQEIILFSEQNFTGRQKSFYLSTTDLRTDSIGKIAKSHCIIRGFWRISGVFDSNPVVKFMENAYGDDKGGKICGNWNTANKTAEYRSIHPVGAPDLDTSAITFNPKPRFFGEEELAFDGTFLRLPSPIKFNSYGFTGKDNWTIYKTTDLSGFSECLEANVDSLGHFAVTFHTNKSLTVGSVWRGCGPDISLLRKEPESSKNIKNNKPPMQLPRDSGSQAANRYLIWMIALLSPISLLR